MFTTGAVLVADRPTVKAVFSEFTNTPHDRRIYFMQSVQEFASATTNVGRMEELSCTNYGYDF